MTSPLDDATAQIRGIVDTYAKAECTLAVAAQQTTDNQTLAAAQAADQATIAQLEQQAATDAATITDLKAQLAALQPKPKITVGAHVNGIPFTTGVSRLGNLPVTRHFCPGALPTDFASIAKQYPAGTRILVSYTQAQTNVAAFAKSATDQLFGLCYRHEPENPSKYGGVGSKFVTEWNREFDTVKAANPAVYMPMIAMSYQYRPGGTGAKGAFLPDPSKVDAYYVDDYEGNALPGLAKDTTEFGPWYALVKDRGKPLGFAEYGRGLLAGGQTVINNRLATLPADTEWLLAHPEFELLLYWYATGSAGDWRFTDAASVAAWQKMVAALTA